MKRSKIFWNVVAFTIQLIIGFINLELLFLIQGMLCCILMGYLFDADEPPLLLWITPLGIFIFAIGFLSLGIIYICSLCYKRAILPFNEWINKV
jgi:hypothetical protein